MESRPNSSMKEAAAIIMHVRQAVEEHKKIQQAVENYLEKNGIKKEYEHFVEKRMKNVKETGPDISKPDNLSKKDEKREKKRNVKRAAAR